LGEGRDGGWVKAFDGKASCVCYLSMRGDGESLAFTPLEMVIIRLGSDDLNGCRFFYR